MENNKNNVPKKPVAPNAKPPIKPTAPKAPVIPAKPSATRPQTIRKPVSNVNAMKKQSPQSPPVSKINSHKEREMQNKLSEKNRKSAKAPIRQADRVLLEEYERSNKRIAKAKKSIRKPILKASNPNLSVAKGLDYAIYYGLLMMPIREARKRALVIIRGFDKNKSRRRILLLLLLLLLIFGSLASGTYLIINNVIQNQNSITEDDVYIPENDYNEFMLPVIDYVYEDHKVERGLRLYNTSRRVPVYVAFKMDIQEMVGDTFVDIDLRAIPILAGNDIENSDEYETSLWGSKTLNSGTTYYYYKSTLPSDGGSLTLFKTYDVELTSNLLEPSDLSGRTIRVTVTIYTLEATSKSHITNSSAEVWQSMPASIIEVLP